MIHISTEELLKKVDCRYTLVIEVAKRARQIIDNVDRYPLEQVNKPVSAAIEQVYSGQVLYRDAANGDL